MPGRAHCLPLLPRDQQQPARSDQHAAACTASRFSDRVSSLSSAPHASHQAGLGWAFSSAVRGRGLPWLRLQQLCSAMPSITLFTGRDRNRKQAKERKGLSRLRLLDLARFDSMRVNESIRSEKPVRGRGGPARGRRHRAADRHRPCALGLASSRTTTLPCAV